VASLSQGRTAAAQCGLFTYKSVPVIFEPPCTWDTYSWHFLGSDLSRLQHKPLNKYNKIASFNALSSISLRDFLRYFKQGNSMNGQKTKMMKLYSVFYYCCGGKTTYPMGNTVPFCGHKWPERGYDYSRSYSAEVKNVWSYTHTPPHVLMAWISIKNRCITSPVLRRYRLQINSL